VERSEVPNVKKNNVITIERSEGGNL